MNFRDLVEKVREHDRHEPEDCECLLCRLFRDLYETNYTIFFTPEVSRMNQEAYDAGKTVTAAEMKAARLETVEKCLHLLDLYISTVGPLAAKKAIEMFKEEIENE